VSGALQDVWLPEVEAEYFALLRLNRDVAADVGSQFRQFEQVLDQGIDFDSQWVPLDSLGLSSLFVSIADHAAMYFAVCGSRAAIVKWAQVGTEFQSQCARVEAAERTRKLWP
jgi:hypothetical protein